LVTAPRTKVRFLEEVSPLRGEGAVAEIVQAGCVVMAQYQHLPIYKQTYDILLRTMMATKEFPREYKYTLGQKIKDELIELVVIIYRANSAADKARHIESIVERVQAIQLMMRLSHDMKILSRRHYAALSEMTDSLAKQAQGWLRSSGKGKTERV
jgi:hypothetical protein